MSQDTGRYLYFDADLQRAGLVADETLAATSERHHLRLAVPQLTATADPIGALSDSAADGVIVELLSGLPSDRQLRLSDRALRSGRRAWLFWPAEEAVECADAERLRSFRHLQRGVTWLKRVCGPIDRAITRWHRMPTALRWIYRGEFPVRRSEVLGRLDSLIARAQPIPLEPACTEGVARLPDNGVYLRADFWARADDGRQTRGVVHGLNTAGSRVVCLMPRHDPLLDAGVTRQVVMDEPRQTEGEDAIIVAPTHYRTIVKSACQALRPSYLYERICLGGYAGAEISQLLGTPYIVEYQGGDVMIQEALGGAPPFYPELYSRAEELALRQATVVVVNGSNQKDALVSRGIDASRVLVDPRGPGLGERLAALLATQAASARLTENLQTGDVDKDQVQRQWNYNPVGSHHARASQPHTLEWFLEVEKHRYREYAPWMPETMEMAAHAGHDVLEIGGGMGTDLAQFAAHGASVTDLDLSSGHLQLAEENFRLRGLIGRFIHHDAESLPFDDGSFDVVYSNGVLHHTPDTGAVVREIHRVLRPGGRAIVMVYAENSLHYWRKLVWALGVKQGLLERVSMGEIMSRSVERTANEAKPLVKVYTKPRLRELFKDFLRVEIVQRQLLAEELPDLLKWTLPFSERLLGWNLIVKAVKP
jgi:ubiquinone/menaquinone biosynthesis C-methylase UbiE